jgi:hypothetical protein
LEFTAERSAGVKCQRYMEEFAELEAGIAWRLNGIGRWLRKRVEN